MSRAVHGLTAGQKGRCTASGCFCWKGFTCRGSSWPTQPTTPINLRQAIRCQRRARRHPQQTRHGRSNIRSTSIFYAQRHLVECLLLKTQTIPPASQTRFRKRQPEITFAVVTLAANHLMDAIKCPHHLEVTYDVSRAFVSTLARTTVNSREFGKGRRDSAGADFPIVAADRRRARPQVKARAACSK